MEITRRSAKPSLHGTTLFPNWTLAYVDASEADARKFLNADQYAHAVQLFDELAYESNPRLSATQDVRQIDAELYELRDKGGILGKINLRVFFAILDKRRLILALGAFKKENEDQTPPYIKIKMRNRLRAAKRIIEEQ